ncbi:MAG: MurR/RpiR family transcriptional regulator [Solirubrobacteraceae bacterium]
MDDAPGSYADLRRRLQARLPQLAPGQARIARVVLSDPEGTAFRTISETAVEAQVADSSVARFATSVGLAGYPALVALCREQLAERTQLLRRFAQAQELGAGAGLLTEVAAHDQRNIAHTVSQIDSRSWDAAVTALSSAPAVHVVGLRKCFSVSYLLAYLLRLVRTDVHLLAHTTSGLVDELRDIAADDVFVAVSIHRYTADTVTALAYAKQRGLRTIVLTDNPASPLAPNGDIVFFVEAGGVTVMRSIAAFISLVQALATAVALQLGTQSRSELLLDEQLLDAFQTYVAKEQPELPPRAASDSAGRTSKTRGARA